MLSLWRTQRGTASLLTVQDCLLKLVLLPFCCLFLCVGMCLNYKVTHYLSIIMYFHSFFYSSYEIWMLTKTKNAEEFITHTSRQPLPSPGLRPPLLLKAGSPCTWGKGWIGRNEKCFMFHVSWGYVSCCIYAVFRLVLYILGRFYWFYAGNCA